MLVRFGISMVLFYELSWSPGWSAVVKASLFVRAGFGIRNDIVFLCQQPVPTSDT